MKKSAKQSAIVLRQAGWSYNVIADRVGVAKSTLSHWLREIPYSPNQATIQRIRNGPAKSATLRHQQKINAIAKSRAAAIVEFGKLTKRDLWLLGLGVYIGEGSKLYESIRIINSDPQVIKLAIKWFREICGLGLSNITITIHMYPDLSESSVIKFWRDTTGLPRSNFMKTQVDTRRNKSGKKHRKLPYGTAHLTIRADGRREFGVALHRRIMGWITASNQQMRV